MWAVLIENVRGDAIEHLDKLKVPAAQRKLVEDAIGLIRQKIKNK